MRGGVFVCHASQDAGTAQRVVAALEAGGVPCWIAPRDIDPGENYTQAILDALEAAPALVLVFSEATNASPHVRRELETAVTSDTRIIPVRLEDVPPSAELRYYIGSAQWLDTGGDAAEVWEPPLLRAVRRAVGDDPGSPPTPPRTAAAAAGPEPDSLAAAVLTPGTSTPRRQWVVLALVGVLVVASVVVTTVLLTRGDDDKQAGPSDTPSTSGSEPSSPATSPATSPAATTDPTEQTDGPSVLGTLTKAEEELFALMAPLDLGPCYSNTEQSVEVFGAKYGVACDLPIGRRSTLTVREFASRGRADDAWARFASPSSNSAECGVGHYEGSYQGTGHRGRLRCSDEQNLSTGKQAAIVSWTDGKLVYNALAPTDELHALVVSYLTPLCVCNPP